MALQCVSLMRNTDIAEAATAKIYAHKYWFSHLRAGAHRILCSDRKLVKGLIWLIGDESALAESYNAGARGGDGGNLEDIISFLQSLVVRFSLARSYGPPGI